VQQPRATTQVASDGETAEVSEDEMEKLRALGYVNQRQSTKKGLDQAAPPSLWMTRT
jgi:hypothetical protein